MYQSQLFILLIILLSCSNPSKKRKVFQKASTLPLTLPVNETKNDTAFQYKEVMQDSTIQSKFRIIYDDYKLYFDSKTISNYCDSIIKLGDERKEQFINIKQEVNNQTHTLYFTNDEIILKTFRPKIINQKTKETGKSLLIASYKNYCGVDKKLFFIITPASDTVLINRIDFDKCPPTYDK
jgi:hypothetical protein